MQAQPSCWGFLHVQKDTRVACAYSKTNPMPSGIWLPSPHFVYVRWVSTFCLSHVGSDWDIL